MLHRQAHGLSFDGTSVHGQISQVRQQLLRTVLGLNKLEKFWCVIYELEGDSTNVPVWIQRVVAHCRPGLSSDENVVSKKAEQEGNVGLRARK